MNPLKEAEVFLKRMIDSCSEEDIKLKRELRTIVWLMQPAIKNDVARFIKYNKCANDEVEVLGD